MLVSCSEADKFVGTAYRMQLLARQSENRNIARGTAAHGYQSMSSLFSSESRNQSVIVGLMQLDLLSERYR